jgi:hypothetical protein
MLMLTGLCLEQKNTADPGHHGTVHVKVSCFAGEISPCAGQGRTPDFGTRFALITARADSARLVISVVPNSAARKQWMVVEFARIPFFHCK